MYTLVIIGIFDVSVREYHINEVLTNILQSQAADATSKLSEKLREYEDVFLIEEVD